MESLGPILELARTGSPYLAGAGVAISLAAVFLREVRRHYGAELTAWSERYAELLARHERCERKREDYLAAWLHAERELADLSRTAGRAVRKVGGS